MTTDFHLTRGALVNVITHISEIVYLEPGWRWAVLCHPAFARPTSRSCRHCAHSQATRIRSPQHRGTCLVAP
jgi:hypothetical protein